MISEVGRNARRCAAALGILAVCAFGAAAQDPAIEKWPETSRALARLMTDKYGPPARIDDGSAVWEGNGPWRETVVYRKPPKNFMGPNGRPILEQTVAYRAPNGTLAELERFEGHVRYDPETATLTSQAETEALNFLSLNLADEIIAGKRSARNANEFYRRTIRLSDAGKSSTYMEGLAFAPADEKAPAGG